MNYIGKLQTPVYYSNIGQLVFSLRPRLPEKLEVWLSGCPQDKKL